MNTVDGVILLVVAISAMFGFLRGLVREVLGLAAWIGAAVVAAYFFPQLDAIAGRYISNPDIAQPVAFGFAFLLVLIALSLVARMLGGAVRRSVLSGLDRLLGLLYGLARGAALAIAAFILAGLWAPVDQWPPEVLEARTLPSIYLGAQWVTQRLPESYRPTLQAPSPEHRAALGSGGVGSGGVGSGDVGSGGVGSGGAGRTRL